MKKIKQLGPTLIQYDLMLTHYIFKIPISKLCHIDRFLELGLQCVFGGWGGDTGQCPVKGKSLKLHKLHNALTEMIWKDGG